MTFSRSTLLSSGSEIRTWENKNTLRLWHDTYVESLPFSIVVTTLLGADGGAVWA
jgi:hypothetical protein